MFFLYLSVSIITALISSAAFAYLWRRKFERDMKTGETFKKLKNEINSMLTDINGVTERNILLIEDRIRAMNGLIDRAGKVVNVLKKEKERQDLSRHVYTELGKSRPFNLVLENTGNEPIENEDVDGQSGNRKSFGVIDSELAGPQSLSTQERILVLFRKGESIEQIASALGISRGEAELTISIHDRRD